jgi:hypothetical protein
MRNEPRSEAPPTATERRQPMGACARLLRDAREGDAALEDVPADWAVLAMGEGMENGSGVGRLYARGGRPRQTVQTRTEQAERYRKPKP